MITLTANKILVNYHNPSNLLKFFLPVFCAIQYVYPEQDIYYSMAKCNLHSYAYIVFKHIFEYIIIIIARRVHNLQGYYGLLIANILSGITLTLQ